MSPIYLIGQSSTGCDSPPAYRQAGPATPTPPAGYKMHSSIHYKTILSEKKEKIADENRKSVIHLKNNNIKLIYLYNAKNK
jgi:hypothetical protein